MSRPRRIFPLLALLAALAAPLASQTATLVRDINPLPDSTGSASLPRDLHAVGAKVFFSAVEATSGRELWVTDGTASGTELLADACPGDCSSNPSLLGAVGSTLFWTTFSANGVQLWRSDGTRAGTFPLTGEGIGLNRFLNELVYAFSDRLFFFVGCIAPASCQPWASDCTTAGTRPLTDLRSPPGGALHKL